MTVKGILHAKGETQQITPKFSKREFAIKTDNEKYPQFIGIQLINEKCAILDQWEIGDEIEANINLRGRQWETPDGKIKYINTLEAWRLTTNPINSTQTKRDGIEQNFVEDKLQAEQNDIADNNGDDLPF